MTAALLRVQSIELLAGLAAFLTFAMMARPRRFEAAEVSPEPAVVELHIVSPGGIQVSRSPVPVTLGRAPEASVVLPDTMVSRLQARIDVVRGRAFIEDLDSRNGTFVNGKEVRREPLSPGDEIVVGTTRLVFTGVA